MSRLSTVAAAVVAVQMASFAPPALAESYPDLGILRYAPEVPDAELAGMRGRFVQVGQVQFFGIQLHSSWHTADGQILGVSLNLGFDRRTNEVSFFHHTGPSPSVEVQGLPPPEAAPEIETVELPAVRSAGGLTSVSGVTQSIQLAGDRNGVRNDVQINIVSREEAGSIALLAGPRGIPLETAGSAAVVSEMGARQVAVIEENTLGVAIVVPQQGTVLQEIRGAGFNRISQFVHLTSSFNEVNNVMNINFALSALNSSAGANLTAALQALRVLQQ